MPDIPVERIKQIKSFPSLVKFLRDDLDWPLESEEIEELTFEYEPDELGIDPEIAVKIKEIKQLRPLAANQPWGIFYIGFEPKRLPVVVLRRVLQKLVIKKRQSAKNAHRNAWELHDLLFISSYGKENQRAITFAHFSEDQESKLPTLRVIGWDSQDTPLHMDRCINELENLTFDEELSPDDWRQKWSKAFTLRHREVISTSKSLAVELAALSTRIRQRVNKVLAVESEKGPIRQLYKAFQETLIHDLSEDDFADMYAQTITYGLFSTKKSRPAGLVAENLLDMIPKTNPFLKELLSTFLTVGGHKGKIDFDELGIDDVVQTLRNTDMDAVLRDFEDRNPLEDPVIHFYEGFLKEYDAKKKVKRGVFYTPRPVVSFIVRTVNEILRKDFGLEYGLADITTWGEMQTKNKDIKIPEGVSEHDPFVQILDPAAGTGTFLVEVIDLIYKTMKSRWEKEGHLPLEFNKLWNDYVPRYLLPRLYGFELMMAPYAIAHMKIGLKLFETGYHFGSDERVRIYLTNSLEKPRDISGYFETMTPALAHEAKAANRVKDFVSITVLVGNPPYAYKSVNTGEWISKLIRAYYMVEGKPLKERNPKGLQDDYVKFIRFGQHRIEQSGLGILSFVTNHGYIDNPTFRGMRQSLIDTFDRLSFVDLHGNVKKKEKTPEGRKDENVFDIEQGVAISAMVKNVCLSKKSAHADFWGDRDKKYMMGLENTLTTLNSTETRPASPLFLFRPCDESAKKEYEECWSVVDIFKVKSVGIVTSRDNFVLDFDKAILTKRIRDFINDTSGEEKIRERYLKASDKLPVRTVQEKLRNENWSRHIIPCHYRPFDTRYIIYNKNVLGRSRENVLKHMLLGDNLAILFRRQYKHGPYSYMLVGKYVAEARFMENAYSHIYVNPLYLYESADNIFSEDITHKRSENFTKKFRYFMDKQHKTRHTPEQILGYFYAILHSETYRKRYTEFLKVDFPRIPITSNKDLFRKLSSLGSELVALHLMESNKLKKPITTFPVSGDNAVTKVGETKKKLKDVEDGKGKLFISKTQYFDGLSEEVWNFHIGGYQVCYKWLYDRKKAGRKLSTEDIKHYHKIVVAIDETIKIMKQIDEAITAHGAWPIR